MDLLAVLSSVAGIFGGVVTAGELVLKYIKFKGPKKKEQLKDNVAIIVDFNSMSIEESVKRYLKANGMDATIIVCTNPNGYPVDINDPDAWQEAVKGLYALINTINSAAPKKVHIFMNAPVALTFALGYVLRPNCMPYVYQYNNEKTADSNLYKRVLHVNDSLRRSPIAA